MESLFEPARIDGNIEIIKNKLQKLQIPIHYHSSSSSSSAARASRYILFANAECFSVSLRREKVMVLFTIKGTLEGVLVAVATPAFAMVIDCTLMIGPVGSS